MTKGMIINYTIFCDMDGVLVDFKKGYFNLTGKDIKNTYHTGKEFWIPIDNEGVGFWNNLEWMPDGKELWEYIEKYKPKLLSSPSIQNDSRVGKHKWVQRELPGVHLILRFPSKKQEFASPKSILIDDRVSNIEQWRDAGGIAIYHTSTNDTISQLKNLNL